MLGNKVSVYQGARVVEAVRMATSWRELEVIVKTICKVIVGLSRGPPTSLRPTHALAKN